jgi:hypothetical protein
MCFINVISFSSEGSKKFWPHFKVKEMGPKRSCFPNNFLHHGKMAKAYLDFVFVHHSAADGLSHATTLGCVGQLSFYHLTLNRWGYRHPTEIAKANTK